MSEKLAGREKEQYVSRLFGSIASKYDLLNSVISLGLHRGWRRTAVKLSGLGAGGTALDVASGTGDFAIELALRAGEEGRVVATDFCAPMLEIASQKLAGFRQILLAAANAEHLPFASDSFDCTTIGFALRNVADVQSTIAEMARVTKPGGRVVSLEIVGPAGRALKPLWNLYFSKIIPWIARLFGGNPEAYTYLPNSVTRFCTREELAQIFRDCGLVDVNIRNLLFGAVCIHMGTKR